MIAQCESCIHKHVCRYKDQSTPSAFPTDSFIFPLAVSVQCAYYYKEIPTPKAFDPNDYLF